MLEPTSKTSADKGEAAAANNQNRLDEKKSFDNSATFDSGYLSSQQIHSTSDFGLSSSEIAVEQRPSSKSGEPKQSLHEPNVDSGVIDDQEFSSDYQERPMQKGDPMIIESNVSEWMCELTLKDKNNLDRPKEKPQPAEKPSKEDAINRLRDLCYQTDDDGET